MSERRCRRRKYCAAPELVVRVRHGVEEEVVVGGLLVGRPTTTGLCVPCEREVADAARSLPADYTALGHMLGVTGQAGDSVQVNGSRELKVPIRLEVATLQCDIDNAVSTWVEPVAEAVGVEWNTRLMSMMRPHARVRQASTILCLAAEALVALGPVEVFHWVESLGLVATAADGTEAGLLLLELHNRAVWWTVGGSADVRIPQPCPSCETKALVRLNGGPEIRCMFCATRYSDTEYRALCANLLDEEATDADA